MMLLLNYGGRGHRVARGGGIPPNAQDECLLDTCTYITPFYIYLYTHCIYTVNINKAGLGRKQRKSGRKGRLKKLKKNSAGGGWGWGVE